MKKGDLKPNRVRHTHDHVKQNIKIAGKINEVKDVLMTFKKTVLDRSNEQNLKLVKKAQFKVEKKRRRVIVRHMSRWDNFRERRVKMMDKYIYWRRR